MKKWWIQQQQQKKNSNEARREACGTQSAICSIGDGYKKYFLSSQELSQLSNLLNNKKSCCSGLVTLKHITITKAKMAPYK